ncbi:TPA: hypothetical protein N0F65_000455, partial [Lagenidium giganteum]
SDDANAERRSEYLETRMGSSSSSQRDDRKQRRASTRTQSGPRPIAGRDTRDHARSEMIPDQFTTVQQVTAALRRNGLESCNLIIGIDFTKSNEWSGKRTFAGRSLHTIDEPGIVNPYEEVIETVGRTLRDFDDDNIIPVYGFGDDLTGDHSVFTFAANQHRGVQPSGFPFERIRSRYREIVPNVVMAGPTSFAPIINEAVNIVNQTGQYHILVIIADGQVTRSVDIPPHAVSKNEKETIDAITYASNFPLSIVMVGVGDGPWESMVYFDNYLMHRKFDNFQFVEFHKIASQTFRNPAEREAQFALNALMEIPDQYRTIKELGYLSCGSYNFSTNLPDVEVYPAPQPPGTTVYPSFAPGTMPAGFADPPSKPAPLAAPAQIPAVALQHQYPSADAPSAPSFGDPNIPMVGAVAVPAHAPAYAQARAVIPSPRRQLQSQLSAAEEKFNRLQEELLCAICEDRNKDTVFQCGHETCNACAQSLQNCPSCRQPIQVRIKRYDNDQEQDDVDAQDCRRRTSIPPSFVFGAASPMAKPSLEERRWRSFDCYSGSSCSSVSKAATIDVLDSRIERVGVEVAAQKSKMHVRKRDRVRSFFSSTKREQVELRRIQLEAQVAAHHRSLTILNDLKTLRTARHSMSSIDTAIGDQNNQTLLESIADADMALSEDIMHHVLALQAKWLHELASMHGHKATEGPRHRRRLSASASSAVMLQFLDEFLQKDGSQRVPCTLDVPTQPLVRFEKLVQRYRLLKPQLKKALIRVCVDTMASISKRRDVEESQFASVFQNRDASDVMRSLVREVTDAIAEEALVPETHRCILRAFAEQMVFGRLAAACYQPEALDLDERNAMWREQVVKARALGLHEVGLPAGVISPELLEAVQTSLVKSKDGAVSGYLSTSQWFIKSIDAFSKIPYLVPSCVMAAFLHAIRVLYAEANEVLQIPNGCVSADVLLPLLIYVLSRSNLPHMHAQIYSMETFAIDACKDGSEAAYYVACLQAAVGYIMSDASVEPTALRHGGHTREKAPFANSSRQRHHASPHVLLLALLAHFAALSVGANTMATPICSLTIQDLIWYDKKTGQRLPCALYNGKPAAICTWACRCRQPEGDKGVYHVLQRIRRAPWTLSTMHLQDRMTPKLRQHQRR